MVTPYESPEEKYGSLGKTNDSEVLRIRRAFIEDAKKIPISACTRRAGGIDTWDAIRLLDWSSLDMQVDLPPFP